MSFAEIFGIRELESLGYRVHGVVCAILCLARFSRKPTCDRQTDTHVHRTSRSTWPPCI